jgi:hypothetical protein
MMTGAAPFEVIIAADAEKARDFANARGWKPGARGYYREGQILVRFIATPPELKTVPRGTRVHIGAFPGGLSAAWVEALAPLAPLPESP